MYGGLIRSGASTPARAFAPAGCSDTAYWIDNEDYASKPSAEALPQ